MTMNSIKTWTAWIDVLRRARQLRGVHALASDVILRTIVADVLALRTTGPTCDKTAADCRDKHDNLERFGGFPGSIDQPCPFALGDPACGREVDARARAEAADEPSCQEGEGGGECERCFGTGLLHGFQVGCPAGCPPMT